MARSQGTPRLPMSNAALPVSGSHSESEALALTEDPHFPVPSMARTSCIGSSTSEIRNNKNDWRRLYERQTEFRRRSGPQKARYHQNCDKPFHSRAYSDNRNRLGSIMVSRFRHSSQLFSQQLFYVQVYLIARALAPHRSRIAHQKGIAADAN